ncbi:PaaI family thioesterase [Chitinivorax sp. B]|uniref:PaaI family thioesterase n=1 Tax=Chitinivorax sp. B TaxID=2502235 RepID=UPI0010F6E09B|nr:PaaI family thioesterase [Chitinivorax sp. B]
MSTLPLPVINQALFDSVARWFTEIPHSKTIGLQYVQGERGRATMKIDYRVDLVGNPKTGVVHGGVITSLIDTTSGLAVFSHLPDSEAIATLDLRIDYLQSAIPGQAIYCTAECYRLTKNVAFTRATAYQEGQEQPIAYSVGTFMRDSSAATIK